MSLLKKKKKFNVKGGTGTTSTGSYFWCNKTILSLSFVQSLLLASEIARDVFG
jgi:hypothetical protein